MNKPEIPAYDYHAILCCGEKCVEGNDRSLLVYLKNRLIELGMHQVRANMGGCLGVCMQEPVMVVYPGGVWYCNLNKANIDRIIEEHFGNGCIVEDLMFHHANGAE